LQTAKPSLNISIDEIRAPGGTPRRLSRNGSTNSAIFPSDIDSFKELGAHAFSLGRYPYIVYYRVGRDEISIRHAARRPWEGGD